MINYMWTVTTIVHDICMHCCEHCQSPIRMYYLCFNQSVIITVSDLLAMKYVWLTNSSKHLGNDILVSIIINIFTLGDYTMNNVNNLSITI